MSRLGYTVSTGVITWAATAKTAMTVTAPANQRLVVKGISGFGQGTSNTDSPVEIELLTYASISGGTAGSVTTAKKQNELAESVQATIAGNYSAEPTYTSAVTVDVFLFHPQLGGKIFWPLGDEYVIKGGTGVALRVTSPQADKMAIAMELEE